MIELKNIQKTYMMGTVNVHALRNVSLKISSGEFVAIMGPSGSGKSTLLHTLGFLDRPDSGTYLLMGKDVSGFTDDELASLRNRKAGFIFQQFHLLSRMSALENVELPLIYGGKRKSTQKAIEKIQAVGLSDRASHRPNELSGGQQQRIAIARSLVNEPLIIFADEPTGNLDTKSTEEIINILKTLNQQGKTIVIVTHEHEIAQHAKRTIYMRDGEIVSDEVNNNKGKKGIGTSRETFSSENVSQSEAMLSATEVIDNLRQGFQAIFSNKMRSLLSMLGILIGVASVIAMLALGKGAKESISDRFASLGTNILTIRQGAHRMGGVSMEAGSVTRFTLKDAQEISKIPHVKRVSPSVSGRGQVVYGNKNWNTQIQGVGVDYAEMKSSIPISGRFFIDEEIRARKKLALLGLTVARQLFGTNDPVGEVIKINRINFNVIGVLPEKGSATHGDRDDIVVIPVSTAMHRLLGKEYLDSIDAEIDDIELMEEVKTSIQDLIVRRHHLSGDNEDAFNIRNMAEIQEAFQGMTQTMTALLGSIAAISLLVGGIGIMNIMLVSVTERTREIGLRKAIGARRKDIMVQFLIESVVMTFGGGMIGIVFGIGTAVLLSVLAGWATIVSPFSIILAAGFSIVVGLGFGLWPAHKAAQLNPIEALRYE
ncbi:MAG: ABC transporter permease [Desulfobacterales bacterium]|nr:ABC transporter permease [Desulfobacterales bacterium]